MTTRISRPLVESRTSRGIDYNIEYYCETDDDKNSVAQSIGDKSNFKNGAEISQVRITCLYDNVAPYLVELTATQGDEDYNGSGVGNKDFSTKILDSYSLAEFTFEPEHFGIITATAEDESADRKNTANAACKKGDWIYKNATSSSRGSADLTSASFSFSSSPLDMSPYLSGTPYKCQTKEVAYYTKSSPASAIASTRHKPSGTSWKLDSQDIREVIDSKGKVWTKVLKRYKQTPVNGMIWK